MLNPRLFYINACLAKSDSERQFIKPQSDKMLFFSNSKEAWMDKNSVCVKH